MEEEKPAGQEREEREEEDGEGGEEEEGAAAAAVAAEPLPPPAAPSELPLLLLPNTLPAAAAAAPLEAAKAASEVVPLGVITSSLSGSFPPGFSRPPPPSPPPASLSLASAPPPPPPLLFVPLPVNPARARLATDASCALASAKSSLTITKSQSRREAALDRGAILGPSAPQPRLQLAQARGRDEREHCGQPGGLDGARPLHVDVEHAAPPLGRDALDRGARGAVAVAVDGGVLEEVARGDPGEEVRLGDEVVVDAVLEMVRGGGGRERGEMRSGVEREREIT